MNSDRSDAPGELQQLLAVAHELADASGAAVMPYFRAGISIENKARGDGFDPVTLADRAAEEVIRQGLAQHFPDHAILGEEFDAKPASSDGPGACRWVIDPIDGTRAFILGLPTWGTLIGVEVDGRPTVGLMNQPFTRERFWSDGAASYLRDPEGNVRKLRTRSAQLETAHLSTTSPDMFAAGIEERCFEAVRSATRSCRFGGDCYAYCLLAAGLIDVVIEAGLQPYDIVALIPVVENAGGVVTSWTGGSAHEGGRVVASGDPAVHDEVLRLLARTLAEEG